MAADFEQLCTFSVAGLTLGVDVRKVQEVMQPQGMTRVPTAAPAIRGLINLRGQIVTAIDLRYRLGLPPSDGTREAMNVVIRSDDGAVSFLVDEIGDVLDVDRQAFDVPPSTIPQSLRELLLGVVRLDGRLLLVLDPGKVLETGPGDNEPAHAAARHA
jgi:purine-binding chemotaxis protein CheW